MWFSFGEHDAHKEQDPSFSLTTSLVGVKSHGHNNVHEPEAAGRVSASNLTQNNSFSPCTAPSPPLAKIREHCFYSRVKPKPAIFSHHLHCTVLFTAVFRQHIAVASLPAELSQGLSRNLHSHILLCSANAKRIISLALLSSLLSLTSMSNTTQNDTKPAFAQPSNTPSTRGVYESLQFLDL